MAKMEGWAKLLHSLKGPENLEKKKQMLIECGRQLYREKGRPLVTKDFRPPLPHSKTINQAFGGKFTTFLKEAGLPSCRRKPGMKGEELKNYLKSIRIETDSDCWLTDKYTLDEGGYRYFPMGREKGTENRIHKASYTLFRGKIEKGLVVMHSCDNPECYNPDHLSLDTQANNMLDCTKKGKRASQINRSGGRVRKFLPTDPYDKEQMKAFLQANTDTIQPFNQMIFNGNLGPGGYPRIEIKGKRYSLHKLILAQKLNKEYEELKGVTRHVLPNSSRKPNRADCNPDHLFPGTQSDNVRDCLSYRKNVKLSEKDWQDIYDSHKKEVNKSIRGQQYSWQKRTAEKYGITETHALNIIRKIKKRIGV
jgi:hypothetical protein